MMFADGILLVARVHHQVRLLARRAGLGSRAPGPAKGGEHGEVALEALVGNGLRVAGLELKIEGGLLPDVLGSARRRWGWRQRWGIGWGAVVYRQVGRHALLDNVASVDLGNGLLRVALGGWARLTRVDGVDHVRVHRLEQASH